MNGADGGSAAPGGLHRDAERGARMKSIGLMVMAVTLFSVLDAAAKVAAHTLPIFEITWFRYAIHFIVAAAVLNPWTTPGAWRVNRPFAQIVRAGLLTCMTFFNFMALRHLQLAETVSINFLAPLMITILSVLFLRERIGLHRIGAILVGFAGILMVTRPGLGGFHPAMIYSLLAMTGGALYALMTRSLAASESPGSMLLVMAGVPMLLLLPVQPFVFVMPPDTATWGLLLLCGVTGSLGHFLLILAHRYAPASVIAPFNYAQIIPMVLLGYLVFGDVPGLWTLAGAGVVIISGLYLLHRERTVARRRELLNGSK